MTTKYKCEKMLVFYKLKYSSFMWFIIQVNHPFKPNCCAWCPSASCQLSAVTCQLSAACLPIVIKNGQAEVWWFSAKSIMTNGFDSYSLHMINKPRVAGDVLQSPPSFIDSLTDWLSHPLVQIYFKHCQSQTKRARERGENFFPTPCVMCQVG